MVHVHGFFKCSFQFSLLLYVYALIYFHFHIVYHINYMNKLEFSLSVIIRELCFTVILTMKAAIS